MVWSLTTTRSLSFSRTSNASPENILRILHDPSVLIWLNPFIIHASVDPYTSVYTITDRLDINYFNFETKYRCKFTFHIDGIDVVITANAGTKLTSRYRVHVGPSGSTEVTEQTTIEAVFILMPFIAKTMSAGHNAFFDNLVTKAEISSGGEIMEIRSIDTSVEPVPSSPPPSHILPFIFVLLLLFCVRAYNPGGIQLSAAIIGIAFSAYWLTMTKDPYGLFHLTLNRLPGDDPGIPPQTEWLNMGFWQDTDVFPRACAALAINLIEAAECTDGGKILDVGYGTGESLILLLADRRVPRPSSLTGITSLAGHHRRAQDRITQLHFSLPEPKPEVALYAGDAVYHNTALDHPLDPSSSRCFDTILALDCAYHFNTRSMFLGQSFVKLVPGGRIALADICFDPSAIGSGKAWLITSFFRIMPKQNMVSTKEYVSLMKEIGYVDVQLRDITEDVFPGFARFLKGKGWIWRGLALLVDWYASAGARFVIVSGARE